MRPMKRTGSQFLGGGRGPTAPVPTYGAELLTNGDMETGDPPSSWVAEATATLSTVAGYAGAQALRVTRGSSVNAATQAFTASIGTWLYLVGRVKKGTASSGRASLSISVSAAETPATASGNWDEVVVATRNASGGAKTVNLVVIGSAGQYVDFDNVSLKPITLASMISARAYGTHTTTKAQATIPTTAAKARCGVICNLDSATSPANFVLATHDGIEMRLEKCVGGTYTSLITTNVTYVAGAYVEIRRPAAGNNWQLWYAGSQVGTDQAIADAAIQAATLAGMFNTYSGNTLAAFSCVPS
jgi:hypothetical protein